MDRKHNERITKTLDRCVQAIKQFEEHGIEYSLKNAEIGHFHCYRKSDGKLFQYWASTGKILGYDKARGINILIKMLESK